VAPGWFLFFSYHNDARSNKHQITNLLHASSRRHWKYGVWLSF